MKGNKIYITTTLPYTNAKPHIGHALEFVQADVVARYYRKKVGNENVWLNVGADEHGLKMYEKAQEDGITPQEHVDKLSLKWKEFCDLFGISYNTFYRTSDSSHHVMAQQLWKKADASGDIYKKKYTGLYCVGCEEFKTEKDLIDGNCPDHGKPPVSVSEENYFFRLSKYKQQLLDWVTKNSTRLKPKRKKNELKNWIEKMEDISISRVKEKLPWGIEVPGDSSQVMYVWFDALTDYVNVLENPEAFKADRFDENPTDNPGIDTWWPGTQFFGPDNLRFQGAIWQGMLASFELNQSYKLLCHGMVLASDGTKMSKSKGNGVDPFEQAEKYGIEALRYYLIVGVSTFGDSPFIEEELVNMYNANLANNLGNLLNRVVHLANKKDIDIHNSEKVNSVFQTSVNSIAVESKAAFESDQLQDAMLEVNKIADMGNKYITEQEPWGKDKTKEEVEIILNNLSYLLKVVIDLYEPLLPVSMAKAKQMLEDKEAGVLFEKLEIK